jgi:hypothetical protein
MVEKNPSQKHERMKPVKLFFFPALFVFVATAFTSCSLIDPDPCDKTVEPEIEVGIRAIVHVLDKNKNPIPDQQVNLSLYKIPCGAPAKGIFDFSGPTNAQGIRETTVAYYNLRNTEDEVWADAHAVNLGNGSAMADSEYATYKYDDFLPGVVKEVHVYIYRNF